MKMNQHLVFFADTTSDDFFPQVKNFVDGKIKKTKILHSEQIVYKKKVELNNNFCIPITKNCDFICGLEILGICENVDEYITSVELIIGNNNIFTFYLSECYVMENNGKFLIKIDFDKIFLNYSFLPILAIQFHNIYFKINGSGLGDLDLKCLLVEGLLENELRKNGVKLRHEILFNHYEQYNIVMNGSKIYINFGTHILSRINFIKSLKFQFENPVNFNTITIYGNEQPITVQTRSDLTLIKNGFIMDNFHYKTFLYNKIILEFDENIMNNNMTLTTTNFNLLIIDSGLAALRFTGLKREISVSVSFLEYINIPDNLYLEKVEPRGDSICGISHAIFEENEERIICGHCFSSYKRNIIEEWFKIKGAKICPYSRCEIGLWYKKCL